MLCFPKPRLFCQNLDPIHERLSIRPNMMDLEKIQINLDQIYISINFTKILTD